jgi:hypothetical protein
MGSLSPFVWYVGVEAEPSWSASVSSRFWIGPGFLMVFPGGRPPQVMDTLWVNA